MKSKLLLSALVLTSVYVNAQVDVSVYHDCSKNGYNITLPVGYADVLSSAGRTSCEWVQLWEGGPKWATFNVGATITNYGNLTVGADATSFYNYTDQAPYYNTANVGGLYAWNNPNINGRKTTWTSSVSTGISDVATTLWGSNWQTPTYNQLDTLQNSDYGKTTWTWCDGSTTQYVKGCTLKGYKVSGVGDYAQYSIFLPAAGYFDYTDGTVSDASGCGNYWSSTEYDSYDAYYLVFNSDYRYVLHYYRKYGRSVRAVLADDAASTNVQTNNQVTLTLYANDCEAANVISYPSEWSVRVTAEPDYGYHFDRWSDGNTTNPRTLQVTKNTTLTAQFAQDVYAITTSVNYPERGYTTGDTAVLSFHEISISAIANYGYHFTQWNDGNTSNPRQVKVTEDKNYQASFEKNNYMVVTSPMGNGSVTKGGTYAYLTNISLTATADEGYHFTQWSDGNKNNPRTFTITQDTAFIAQFAQDVYTITTSVNYTERGYTTGDTAVLSHHEISISATANYGYHFTRWNDGNTDNPRTFTPTKSGNYQAIFDCNNYRLTTFVSGNCSVNGGGTYSYLSNVSMTVYPNFGYHFVQWNDGNTDNPRSLTITQDTAFMAIIAKTYSGQCGENLKWSYVNGVLTISGEGDMEDYSKTQVPWGLLLDSIKTISLPAGCTSLGNNCFKDIAGLKEITIPASVTTIGANAFAGCRKLYDIYCYAAEPPIAQSSSFENYNVYLHIPCDNKRDYELDAVFGSFKYIECMGAEPVPMPTTTATVEPTETTAAITWPTEETAATYSIVITKGGEVFCTLIFDAQGHLTSIAFAPGRGANTEAVAATATGTGFSFTVTGLQSGTHYNYSIDAQNSAAQSIKTHTGAFDTKSVTAVENVNDNHNHNRKVIRNGVLLIERNGIYYNAQGGTSPSPF